MVRRRSRGLLVFLSAAFVLGSMHCKQEESTTATATASPHAAAALSEAQLDAQARVAPGKETIAYAYYKKTFDELGLNPNKLVEKALVDSQDLPIALEFLGYKGVAAKDFEDTRSPELNK